MDEIKDVWKTNKFAIQWKNKLANKKDNIKKEPDYIKYLNRMWYAGNIIALVYILLVVGWLIWLYNI